jgi:ABC-type Fe3+-siderophore transport system permease subunit
MTLPIKKNARDFFVLFFVLVVALALALGFGATSDWDWLVVSELRLPRAILALAVGAGLSIAGVVLQALFSNSLCEPYTLGISSGATLGAVMSASLGWSISLSGIAPPAFIGALLFAFILYLIAKRPGVTRTVILLSGVMLGFVGSSLVALWMALADPAGVQGALLWLLGDLSRARLGGAIFSLILVTVTSFLLWRDRLSLDALLMGEEEAVSLGVDVKTLRLKLILLSSLLVGLCVSSAGMIGFIGLLVPHFVRRWRGSLHHVSIFWSGITGGVVLLLADLLSRILVRPYEIPVGVITALVGAPLFVWMMLKKGESR